MKEQPPTNEPRLPNLSRRKYL